MKSARAILALGVTVLVTGCQSVAAAGSALTPAALAPVTASTKQIQSVVHRQSVGIARPVASSSYAGASFASSSKTRRNLLIAGAVVLAVVAAVLLLGGDEYSVGGGDGIY